MAWLREFGLPWAEFVCDTTRYLNEVIGQGKNVLFEAQLGALRDIDFGIFPYTSSSSSIAAYAPVGAGIPGHKLDGSIGIMKAYSSCVGEGPFTCEFFGEEAHALREAGGEYGAATGRPRRVGGFDVALRMRSTVSGWTTSPPVRVWSGPGPFTNISPASATCPGAGKRRTCLKRRWSISPIWSGRWAVPSSMSPWARRETRILRCFDSLMRFPN